MAESIYSKGTQVWFEDKEQGWIRGEVLSCLLSAEEDGIVELKFLNERHKETTLKTTLKEIARNATKDTRKTLPHLCNAPEYDQVNDLTQLPHLNEPSILHVIHNRYTTHKQLYTYSGIVLVAINPFTDVPIYGQNVIQMYAGAAGKKRDELNLEPHLFTIAEEAYRAMQRDSQDQTIIVSGESGAGKTESAKYIMRYMASMKSNVSDVIPEEAASSVEHQVLATNPILEAFGNAKTSRNDNSSRFGKYIQILFDSSSSIVGARIRTYLLERSRISFQQRSERNYHIFYQLCQGVSKLPDSERAQFGLDGLNSDLTDGKGFRYLSSSSSSFKIDNVDDAANFAATCQALSVVGIDSANQLSIFRLLAGILHLGNIDIQHRRDAKDAIIESKSDHALAKATELLGISAEQFARCTTKKVIDARGEKYESARTVDQAVGVRDGVAKFIYNSVFDWLVKRINESLGEGGGMEEEDSMGEGQGESDDKGRRERTFIAVLDIYGFEHFQTNSFEQFCINYANEKLQQQFVSHVFKLEQAEYALESIDWTTIEFSDNQPCIDLIEGKLGILALLDEESRLATGTDDSFIDKLNSQLKSPSSQHKAIFKDHLHGNEAFTIAHYAGDVSYNIDGFLEKNRGTVPDEHRDLLMGSTNEFLREVVEVGSNVGIDSHANPHASKNGPSGVVSPKPGGAVSANGPSKAVSGRKPTQCSVFKLSLLTLTEALKRTSIHYIRCIKPNESKTPWLFDGSSVAAQLKACGVLETIRITSEGYPTRWRYEDFVERYRLLLPSSQHPSLPHPSTLIPLTPTSSSSFSSNEEQHGDIDTNDPNRQLTAAVLHQVHQDLVHIIIGPAAATNNDNPTLSESKSKLYQYGRTKIFFRSRVLAILEGLRLRAEREREERENAAAISIQKTLRGMLGRRTVARLRAERERERVEEEARRERERAEKEVREREQSMPEEKAEGSANTKPPSTPVKTKSKPEHPNFQAQAKRTERARAKTPTTPGERLGRHSRPTTPSVASTPASRYQNGNGINGLGNFTNNNPSGPQFELPHFHPDDSRYTDIERCAACRAKAEAVSRQRDVRIGRLSSPHTLSKSRSNLDLRGGSQSIEPGHNHGHDPDHSHRGRIPTAEAKAHIHHGQTGGLAVPQSTSTPRKGFRSKSIEPRQDAIKSMTSTRPTTPSKLRKLHPTAMLRTARSFTKSHSHANPKENSSGRASVKDATHIATRVEPDPVPDLKIYKQFMGKKPTPL
ncbi:P-loop containing nucleoside triphosphate hydrolase protein [Lentinula edodes]|uniref:P-loop containing nucleoside triphosphate hydrolase protein n=1 Tax=Lentinula lateritia TaxID=40482 RepID=A0A9W9DS68_9AGAR|nr:P-loop containing nucleoside triphosphate hydrolase protein [Lentinula edodes]